ncbi:competence/damage-inducible protein A [Ornithinibacillus halophilus]|uniref:Putative competence-damage inducible protein n=1 Tax=Ornithinibacillus halophilus TaxID=930117 RepID=A0A1M5CEN8_9BACI|nr:competence/damage-inducible protein A [Ornithinibacillus halophilus]SHF53208.1 nicotinamide-nucleotide amidase [Ornithinibacillus halophilus]
MKTINAEIIAVGTELLLGQIANTNAQWISQKLAKYGINVFYHGVVGDNYQRVEDTFSLAQKRSNVVIVTGGLGPTEDDMTREAFQALSKLEIEEHRPSMEKIKDYFIRQNREMTPNNRKQARVFKGAQVLENKVGMAPGMIVTFQETTWIFLPGVPKEMKQLFEDDVLPYLLNEIEETSIIQSTILRFIGIGEAQLEHELQDVIKEQQNPTIAPLAQNDGVIIRLTAKERSTALVEQLLDETKNKVLDRVGKYYTGSDNETIEYVLVNKLKELNKTISAAESLTGGKFTERVISQPGSSKVCPGGIVSYDATVKQDVLGIPNRIIQNYGTVSKECAREMALNVANLLNSDIGISFTGVAGPDSIEGKPVGTVYIAIHQKNGEGLVEHFQFHGDREDIRRRSILKGFELLIKLL